MEAFAAQSVFYANTSKPLRSSCCISSSFLQCKASLSAHQSAQNLSFRRLKSHCVIRIKPCRERNAGVVLVHASSDGGTASAGVAQGWLLEPVGDGDYKHIGFKVEMPGAYEIFSGEMTVGRVPDKADLVIPVATVSGVHARIRNREGSLLVTDLDSTNGTYINEKRVPPGATAVVPPGSLLTFGDTHLAIFRVSKVEKIVEDKAAEVPQGKAEISNGTSAAPHPETN